MRKQFRVVRIAVANVEQLSGSLDLAISDFVSLSGQFGVTKVPLDCVPIATAEITPEVLDELPIGAFDAPLVVATHRARIAQFQIHGPICRYLTHAESRGRPARCRHGR